MSDYQDIATNLNGSVLTKTPHRSVARIALRNQMLTKIPLRRVQSSMATRSAV
ncbi:MAG: hypothetical protein GY896_07200 [Gammaproteobacteria bacterium]|nr:hypothetical protein [Gammaproteobacteria bacterium]